MSTQLHIARQLITEKRYEEAHAILIQMQGEPTAQKWLAKLDEIMSKDDEWNSVYKRSSGDVLRESKQADVGLEMNTQLMQAEIQQLKALRRTVNLLFLTGVALVLVLTLSGVLPVLGYETKSVYCDNLADYAGWRVAAAYSYETGSSRYGYTVYTHCVIERPRTIMTLMSK